MNSIVNYTYWKWEAKLTKSFCQAALEEIDWFTAKQAEVNSTKTVVDLAMRRTDVFFQNPMGPMGCITRSYIEVANQNAGWSYDLTGQEDTQFGRYKSSDNGHYDWHMDSFPPENGSQRKLSCVILLNDPAEFEGGELLLENTNEEKNLLTKQGDIIVFPSFIKHKVTPVTKGVRYTAVTWAVGPSFK